MPADLDAANRSAMRVFGSQAQTGKKWTYTPQAGMPFDVDGIFDEAWARVEIKAVGRRGGIAPLSTTAPAFLLRLADLPNGYQPKQGEVLKNNISQQTYAVADTELDGMGCMRLILTETT